MSEQNQSIPLSLYVHIPWCVRKCPYCDFNSHVMKGGRTVAESESDYVDALLKDLAADLQQFNIERKIQTIFIGGGTPSLFSDKAIGRLLSECEKMAGFASDIEITLEANPGTTEVNFINGYRAAGVTRISLGVQSFQDAYLAKLGRIHDHKEALKAIDLVSRAGFAQWNIDLMYGLPGQTTEDAQKDIDMLAGILPPHVSAYHMTIEPNTTFATRPPRLPDDDTMEAIQLMYSARLEGMGYHQYEVSAHARHQDNFCRHNLNYWQFGDYLGIGAGAHGKISHRQNNQLIIERTEKTPSPAMYLNALKTGDFMRRRHFVEEKDRLFEFGINALRLHDGFKRQDFVRRTGLDEAHLMHFVSKMQSAGYLQQQSEYILPTDKGRAFINNMLDALLDMTPAS